ncbi:MAG: hypothetical protein KBT88_10980 [Gammaproteobacteria bacterium]|nr:hypothetical protein [Gammaproteobacteria bacterium]MBQ0840297.1 hypothetical protein [Gammaproteobacteria bacterium]
MSPEIEQFLSGMKKTIEEVVMPNLTDKFAQEQAGIVAASLGFLGLIQDKAFHYELLENQEYKGILQAVIELLDNTFSAPTSVKETSAKVSEQFAADKVDDPVHLRPYKFIRGSNEVMKELLCVFIQQQPEMPAELRNSFEALMKPFFKSIELRERSWVKALGFDPEAEQQADIADLLYKDGYLNISKS